MTKDGRGREVFSIHPAILGGGARYRTLGPAETDADDQQAQAEKSPAVDPSAGAATVAGAQKRPDRAR